MYIKMHVCIHVCISIFMYARILMCVSVCGSVCVCVCACACDYTCTYHILYMYTQTSYMHKHCDFARMWRFLDTYGNMTQKNTKQSPKYRTHVTYTTGTATFRGYRHMKHFFFFETQTWIPHTHPYTQQVRRLSADAALLRRQHIRASRLAAEGNSPIYMPKCPIYLQEVSTKEPHTSAKNPGISAKEPYMSAKWPL